MSLSSRTMPDEPKPTEKDRDEPLKIELDPEATLRGLLKVEPKPEDEGEAKRRTDRPGR